MNLSPLPLTGEWLRYRATKQRLTLVHRPYLLLLLPLGLALGYGTGRLTRIDIETSADRSVAQLHQPKTNSVRETKTELWRTRVLDLFEEPSFTLQTASYYAFAQKVPTQDLPYVLEGMYPEGWTRFRGDLPLAIFMEWAKRDSSGLSVFATQLPKRYPDLEDNLDSIFFNLGLQNAPGSVSTIEKIADEAARANLASQFLLGLVEEHSGHLFDARLRLLGPQETFARLSDAELENALQNYWANSNNYLKSNIVPSPKLAVEIGKRYQEHSIRLLNTSPKIGLFAIGSIAASGTASPETTEIVNTTWFNWNEIDDTLTVEEKHNVLTFLSAQGPYWQLNQNGIGMRILAKGLDRQLTQKLLTLPAIPDRTKKEILASSTQLFTQPEYLTLLTQVDQAARSSGLRSLLQNRSSQESIELLDSIPTDWSDSELINAAFEKAVQEGNQTTLAEISKRFPNYTSYLPNNEVSASKLWELNPELYLKNIEGLPSQSKEHHLQMIAANAAEEELGLILERGTFDQQTDVLIGLIHRNPMLSAEILKHESPTSINNEQASQIGVSLAYSADQNTALSYFRSTDISQASSQIAVLNFCLSKLRLDESRDTPQTISQLSPKHDYLYRTATAFTSKSDDPEPLLRLKREDPQTFLTTFTSLIGNVNEDSLQRKAQKLLVSPSLTNQEKLEIHKALYGGQHPWEF